jgi:predicted Rossmann fold nucleotide-binding protein DprA/Smf involved in DNA uptake
MNQSCSSPKFVARALTGVPLKICSTINRVTAALVLSACVVAAAAQSDSSAFAKFKREMMPKVGQKITVVGTWSDETKICCWLAFNN